MEVIHSGQSLQFSLLQLCSPRNKTALGSVCSVHNTHALRHPPRLLRLCKPSKVEMWWQHGPRGSVCCIDCLLLLSEAARAPVAKEGDVLWGEKRELGQTWRMLLQQNIWNISAEYCLVTREARNRHNYRPYWWHLLTVTLSVLPTLWKQSYTYWQHQRMNFIQKFIEKSIIHREHIIIITLLTMTIFHPDFKIVFWYENAVTMEERETFCKCFPFYSFDCSITVTSLFHQVKLNPERTLKPSQ